MLRLREAKVQERRDERARHAKDQEHVPAERVLQRRECERHEQRERPLQRVDEPEPALRDLLREDLVADNPEERAGADLEPGDVHGEQEEGEDGADRLVHVRRALHDDCEKRHRDRQRLHRRDEQLPPAGLVTQEERDERRQEVPKHDEHRSEYFLRDVRRLEELCAVEHHRVDAGELQRARVRDADSQRALRAEKRHEGLILSVLRGLSAALPLNPRCALRREWAHNEEREGEGDAHDGEHEDLHARERDRAVCREPRAVLRVGEVPVLAEDGVRRHTREEDADRDEYLVQCAQAAAAARGGHFADVAAARR